MNLLKNHGIFEKNSWILGIGIVGAVIWGGLVQIAPLFFIESTIEKVDGVRPYTPLELIGRNVYVREGCYTCHSQMVRSLRDEVERYGHYSLAAESMYDRPFQWGSKRTGPDLARVGGKYSDGWHVQHLANPRSVVPESVMPPYEFLKGKVINAKYIADDLKANKLLGVPYTDKDIAEAQADVAAQAAAPDTDGTDLNSRYGGKVNVRDFDGNAKEVTEMDALVAYLQVLGTMVDFKTYEPKKAENLRQKVQGMTYEALAKFAQQSGSVYFAVIFFAVCVYALWPKNKEKFDQMAHVPLEEPNDDAPLMSEHSGLEK